MKRLASRILAVTLSLLLLSLPLAQALTPQQAAELLQTYYIDAIPPEVLESSTVDEMISALGDRYTQYLSAEEYQAFLSSMNDSEVVGIGVALHMEAEGARISSVYPNSPAADCGLQKNDLITAVDGVSLVGAQDASSYLRGEAGTSVRITVRRGSSEPHTYFLTRRKVDILQTLGALVDGHIGWITCSTFGDKTAEHFTNILQQYENKADVWVIDLRGNNGGLTQAAVNAASLFIGNSIMAYLRDRNGQLAIQVPDISETALTQKPAIVLIDGETASAAELFAAAMRDYGKAVLVGSRSYGKGVAQVMLNQDQLPDYFPDGDALKITSYRFFAPYASTNDKIGLLPTLLLDDKYAEQVALLLSGRQPENSTGNYRLDLCGMTFYIDGATALSSDYIDAFREVLSAAPPATSFYRGTGGALWTTASLEDTALLDTGWVNSRSFDDVQSSPYRNAIQTLAAYGIASPGETQFYPQGTLTRGELCLTLARLFDVAPSKHVSFPDVPKNTELARAVDILYGLGCITGYGDGKFRPDAPLTNQEFLTTLARAAAFWELNAAAYYQMEAEALPLDDPLLRPYAAWARRGVWLCSYLDLLWDDVTTLSPIAKTTREQAAESVYRLMCFCGYVPAAS